MSTHLYYPTEEERQRVRDHIGANSGFTETGQPKPGRKDRDVLYPKGMKSFAAEARVNYRQMRRILMGTSGTRVGTWKRIVSQMETADPRNEQELLEELARIRGCSPEKLERLIEAATML